MSLLKLPLESTKTNTGAAMPRGVLVDYWYRVAGAYPVRWVAEFARDHHHGGELGRSVAGEPGRRQVDVFAPVLEIASAFGDIDSYHLAGVGMCIAQSWKIFCVDLIREPEVRSPQALWSVG